jgi:CRISPR-associated endonuclease/helicase Cas3
MAFQAYIRGTARGTDHSTAGAREAMRLYSGPTGQILAFLVAGHHAGLADGATLPDRLAKALEPYSGWEAHAGPLPAAREMAPPPTFRLSPHRGFSEAFLIRMLFSCLVDADFLETEAFHDRTGGRASLRGGHAAIPVLRDRLRAHVVTLGGTAAPEVDALRAEVLAHAVAKAAMPPGLFTLTVPTGGGKTLTGLSFALEHAVRHGLDRVIQVIPFTSIIEQTAAVFRRALDSRDDVLEHHASFDWEAPREEDGPDGLAKLRRAAENWDVPVVVTTAVQFFESLFAHRTSRCRKLHNLARAVIVLDEAQNIPLPVLRPCMAAIEELARNYGSSVVLCTATQPALKKQDEFAKGLDIPPDRELAPDPPRLYAALRRVRVVRLPDPVPDEVVAARFSEQPRMLCIVNSRAHARALYEMIQDLPGAVHLSTLMCPKHRRAVLAEARRRLLDGEPVRIVSTSLIEAGVDIDLPEVWRAVAGVDSIAQAAGRCNRNGTLVELGRVVVFEPEAWKPAHDLKLSWQAARPVLRRHDDPLGLDAVRDYFRELYWQRGEPALDATEAEGCPRGVLPALAERARGLAFPFRSLGEAFRLIRDAMEPVIVPLDEEAKELLRALRAMDRPAAGHLRALQAGYVVSIPRAARAEWLRRGALAPVHPALGEELLAFGDDAHYRRDTGLDLGAIGLREAEKNIFG